MNPFDKNSETQAPSNPQRELEHQIEYLQGELNKVKRDEAVFFERKVSLEKSLLGNKFWLDRSSALKSMLAIQLALVIGVFRRDYPDAYERGIGHNVPQQKPWSTTGEEEEEGVEIRYTLPE